MSVLNSAVLGVAGVGWGAAALLTPDASFRATFLSDHAGGGPLGLAPARPLTLWMLAFLFLDLAVGLVAYREHLEWLSAWVHHSAYLVLLPWVLARGQSALFAAGCAAELPTLLLALGSVHRPWRTDLPMGVVFAATRVGLFAALAARHHALTGGGPDGHVLRNLYLACLALHAWWFAGWARSYAKGRARAAAAAAAAKAAGAPSPPASTPYTGSTPGGGGGGGTLTPSSASSDAGAAHGAGAAKKVD
jgi:hypothetical protein